MSETLETILNHDVKSISGGNITSLEPLEDTGEVNQVFLVTANHRRYVARVNGVEELPRFQKEEWCINQAVQAGVKSPQVLSVASQGDTAYMLMEYIDGQRTDKEGVDQSMVWRTLGQYAKLIHSVATGSFGEDLSDLTEASSDKWDKYLTYNISSLDGEDILRQQGIITEDQATQLKTYFGGLAGSQFKFGLSHGDLSLDNAIVCNDSEVNLLDWGSAAGHVVPHYDLGVILTDSISEDSDNFRSVLDGYELSLEDFGAIAEEVKSIMLLIATDKIRWAIDRSPESLDSAIEHFIKSMPGKQVLVRCCRVTSYC
jgi:aminoglycoside phosphotransferase (APT) family kinase protein